MTKALEIWNALSPMERYSYMERVGYMKSTTKRLRACLALIASEKAV